MQETLDHHGRRVVVLGAVLPLLHALLLVAGAGSLDWPRLWAYMALHVVGITSMMLWTAVANPAVLNARGKRQTGTAPFDRPLLRLHVLCMLSMLVTTGLDERFGWSRVPLAVALAAGAVLMASYLLSGWALSVNPHFEPTVRIQRDRDHRVVDEGPYRFVRHPGYLAAMGIFVATPLFLDSLVALVPATLDLLVFFRRTQLEDRLLQRELDGYAEFARRVPGRLLPRPRRREGA